MAMTFNVDVELAKRKMSVTELSERVGVTRVDFSIFIIGKDSIIQL